MTANTTPDHAARVSTELARMMATPRTPQNDAEWAAKVRGLRVEMVRAGAWERERLDGAEIAMLEKLEQEEDE